MKTIRSRFLIVLFAATAIITAIGSAFAAERPNFNGTWVLAKDKCANLPALFQTVDEYNLIITQTDDKSITLTTKFSGRGQTISDEPQTYPIDGSTVEKNDKRGFTIKRN